MKDFDAARTYYQKTIELAPRGFFTAITAIDTLSREQKGELPSGTYLAYLSLEWINDPAKRAAAVHQLVKRVPHFAPAWEQLALLTDQDPERLNAIENGLKAQPDAETMGMLEINKALVLNRQGNHEGAVRLLGNSPSTRNRHSPRSIWRGQRWRRWRRNDSVPSAQQNVAAVKPRATVIRIRHSFLARLAAER
jgi:hypothetical protein